MPPPRYASPFAPLNLSPDEKTQLRETATALVDSALQLYEKHLWHDNEKIDAARWSLVRKREDVRVFHDRRVGAGTANERMHLLLTVGTLQGTLHDALYGSVTHTTDDMRIRTTYAQDTLLDGAVLESLHDPTDESPFESMSVRWFVKGIPLLVRMIAKPGDNVFLAAAGFRRLSNGERVGFNVMHSVAFDRTPPLPQYVRVNSSICVMWRQKSPAKVEMFMTSFVENPTVVAPLFVRAVADGLISLWRIIDCAQRKKLAWLVRQRRDDFAPVEDQAQALCCVCKSHSRSARHGSACAVCRGYACSKCRVKRQLSFVTRDKRLVQPKFSFCMRCLTDANSLDAAICARGELTGYALEHELGGTSGERRKTWSSSILSLSFSSRVAGDESFWGRGYSLHSTASADASISSASPSNSIT